MVKEELIRDRETNFIKKNLEEGKNLLVVGEKGVGKTTIIKQSSKKILSIDLVELENTDNLSSHLSFKGKNHIFIKKIEKNTIKIISIFISYLALVYSSIVKKDSTLITHLLPWIPIIIFGLILLFSLLIWFILKKNTKKIIHFHEMNFINDKKEKEKILRIIWKIKNIYKNHQLIFESDEEFDKDLKYKFNLKEIHLKIVDKWSLIKNLFKKLKNEFENEKIKIKVLEKLEFLTNWNKSYIDEITYNLSYRTFKNIIQDFKDLYTFSKQEINLLDFLILKFLQLKDSKLYYKIIKEDFYNMIISKEESKVKEDFLKKMKSMLPNVTKYIENQIKPIFNLEKEEFYSFFNPKYKSFYFSILNYDFLEMELMEKFKNEPLVFLKQFNEINLSEIEIFKFIEDKEIIEFLDFIEKKDSEKLLNYFLENDVFLNKYVFTYLRKLIINTRKNKKLFFNSLPKKYKYYFFHSIYEFIFKNEELKKIENELIPFKNNNIPKNLILIGNIYEGKQIFNYQNYYKKIIKDKNKFLILLISQLQQASSDINEYDPSNNNFFMIQKFLSTSEIYFLVKCFDEFNKKISKNKNLKIKKFDSKEDWWKDVSNEELEKYRNFKK